MHPYLLVGLPVGPILVRRFAEKIPEYQWDHCFAQDRFTTREVVAHLADWEPIFRSRMETAIHSPGGLIQIYEEGQRAVDEDYASWDMAHSLNLFEAERAKTIDLLSSLDKDQFRAAYTHPVFRTMFLEDQANFLLGHDLYHIEQLSAYLDVATDLVS